MGLLKVLQNINILKIGGFIIMTTDTNSVTYFNKSLESLNLLNFEAAINFIDLAITNAVKKDFYMLQKTKILFVANLLLKCSDYILENILYFYQHSPLHIFSQILYYYQTSSGCSTLSLQELLTQNNIPSILANEYSSFIDNPNVDLLEKAIYAKENNSYLTCIHYCDLLLKQDPSNISIYLMKAKCQHLLGEHNIAIDTYKEILSLQPNLVPIYHDLGIIMMELKRYPEAISCFQQATVLDPSKVDYITQLAEAFYQWRKYDSALTNFKKALAKKPSCSEILLRIADTYNQTNKPKKAKKYYKKVLNLKPYNNSLNTKMPLICNLTD